MTTNGLWTITAHLRMGLFFLVPMLMQAALFVLARSRGWPDGKFAVWSLALLAPGAAFMVYIVRAPWVFAPLALFIVLPLGWLSFRKQRETLERLDEQTQDNSSKRGRGPSLEARNR